LRAILNFLFFADRSKKIILAKQSNPDPMLKKLSVLFIFTALAAVLFFACKKSEGEGIAPTYKSEGTSTGNNPYNPPATT
jgi:hypothetical protein